MSAAHPATRTTITLAAAALATAGIAGATTVPASAHRNDGGFDDRPVSVDVEAPSNGDNAGIGGIGWFVDLEIDYPGGPTACGVPGSQGCS